MTAESLVTAYNNFYEFGSYKQIAAQAQGLTILPWAVKLDGMVEQEQTLGRPGPDPQDAA